MRTALSPWGILIGHTLPTSILIALYASMLTVVHPLLSDAALEQWWTYGGALAAATCLSTGYALMLLRQGRTVHFGYSLLLFLAYIPLLYGFMSDFRELLPWDVPRWMVPQDAELYALRLLAVPLAHALFVLIVSSLQRNESGSPVRDLGIAVVIPIACYLFVQVIEPWRWDLDFERHVWVILFITLVLTFLFFLLRGVAALVLRKGPSTAATGLILRVVIALVLPLLGLALNNGLIQGVYREAQGVVGDLGHWGFYAVAVLNAVVVIWPSSPNPHIRLFQFILRATGFSYVCYFFLLFLPFLPLSIVAIIVIGIGFLLLAPILLFAVQGTQLVQDARYLVGSCSRTSLLGLFVCAFAVLPLVITAKYLWHRKVLHEALDHVYHAAPRPGGREALNPDAIRTVLDHVAGNKESRARGNTPFLTPYYNLVVLDNLTLSEGRIKDLRRIFLNEEEVDDGPVDGRMIPDRAQLDTATTRSTYQQNEQEWRTWVELSMSHHVAGQGEYVTTFTLPDGAWISDTYLMIEGRRVPGILAEKKAAEWVYSQIVNVRRDPSITRYVGPNTVEMRVFPFVKEEVRQAGFEVLHKEPFALRIDDTHVLMLGDSTHAGPTAPITTGDGSTTYISEAVKRTLTPVQRTKAFHFIVDGTDAQRARRPNIIRSIEDFLTTHRIDPSTATLHIADAYHEAHRWTDDAAQDLLTHVGNGGFFSDRAVRTIITAACTEPTSSAPLIVFVPSTTMDTGALGVWLDDLHDIAACLPEGDHFHVLRGSGTLERRSFQTPDHTLSVGAEIFDRPAVLAWPDARSPQGYLPLNGPSIVVKGDQPILTGPLNERNWQDALRLEGAWRIHQLHPTGGTEAWRQLVRSSFQAQVLTPTTAWMCLEDEAQRNALLKKQEEVLNADKALDTEEITAMSEPDIFWLILPVLLFIVLRSRRG